MGTLGTLQRSSHKAEGTRSRPRNAQASSAAPGSDTRPFQVVPARAGDHHAVHCLLSSILHRPALVDFQSQLDDPLYEPSDRVLVKQGDQLVAHALLTRRQMHFGRNLVPITIVNDFVVLPEMKHAGIDGYLLDALTQQMRHDSDELAILRTAQPEFFRSHDWVICLRHSHSIASPREILAQLQTVPKQPRFSSAMAGQEETVSVRMWRHVEQAALIRLYTDCAEKSFGPLQRSPAYWSWLISRRGYDRLYVATQGPDTGILDDSVSPIVGYAVMRDHRILEMVGSPDCPQATAQLLARACRDAIEHDRHCVQMDMAPDDPLHAVFAAAGGECNYYEADHGEVRMVYLPDPIRFLRSLGAQLVKRARGAELPMPLELGLRMGQEKFSFAIGPRRIKIDRGRHGRSYLECDRALLSQLLLGHLDVAASVNAGRLQTSTRVAQDMAAVLFPQLPVWRPPWDEIAG